MNDLQVGETDRGGIPVLGQNRTCPMKETLVIVDVADKVTSAPSAA